MFTRLPRCVILVYGPIMWWSCYSLNLRQHWITTVHRMFWNIPRSAISVTGHLHDCLYISLYCIQVTLAVCYRWYHYMHHTRSFQCRDLTAGCWCFSRVKAQAMFHSLGALTFTQCYPSTLLSTCMMYVTLIIVPAVFRFFSRPLGTHNKQCNK